MNAARPAPGEIIARLDELSDLGAVALEFAKNDARYSLVLARNGADVFAFENRCPHAGYPLQRADGSVLMQEGRYLVCTMHGASFDVTDGACAGGPCNGDALTPIDVDVSDGVVRISV